MNQLYIYDEIGRDGITAKGVAEELATFGGSDVEVHINSGGGSVSQGIAIYNQLDLYAGNVTVYVDGLAASIASVIAMAGDSVVMAEGALIMVHSAWSQMAGNASDMRKEADTLDLHDKTIRAVYGKNTGLSDIELIDIMESETWMDGNEAIALGFAHSEAGELKYAASVDYSRFNKLSDHHSDLLNTISSAKAEEAPHIDGNDAIECMTAHNERLAVRVKLGELSL